MSGKFQFSNRKYVVSAVAVIVTVVYIVRLFSLQILSEEYKKNADSNAFRKEIQYPSRGLILDRKGKLMVFNEPSYNIMVVMQEQLGVDTADFCRTIGITEEEFKQISVNVVKKLYTKYGVKALTCHDSVWLREDQSDIDVRRIFYDEIDLMAYNELKLDAVLENRSVFDLMAEDERRL